MTDERRRRPWRWALGGAAAVAMGFIAATWGALRDFPQDIAQLSDAAGKPRVLANDGTPLSFTLENAWNATDVVPLSAVPPLLQTAFIVSEDQHFYQHGGVDWPARFAALWLDARQRAAVRGASTITEQVVRMMHPRPRTLWSRWLEGFEAAALERRLSKADILSFYLNQVPYADRRRGIVQAARLYFNRDLGTLSPGEQLALAVLVRSPVGMDLRRNAPRARRALAQLADRLERRGALTAAQRGQIRAEPWVLDESAAGFDASHFVRHVLATAPPSPAVHEIRTTLDPQVQARGRRILDAALRDLAKRHVHDAGLLVIDHRRNEIVGWIVGHGPPTHGNDAGAEAEEEGYDTVLTPRQPGSTMKPLLYALALEKGWTAATMIDDNELSESVGGGQHTFHNYSHRHYGPLRLREALGNSLNIPAVKTLKFVGGKVFMDRLQRLGITSLSQHPEFYGDGLALGNGEISLYEMAQAYTALARQGRYEPLTLFADDTAQRPVTTVFDPAITTLIGNILSDPEARALEFGRGLQFPVETAIKTGTSTDYRDAWAIAFDYRHTVAVWMGNLDGSAMDGVTGAVGPAMVLRSVFAELNRNQDTKALPWGGRLVAAGICRADGRLADDVCPRTMEWFVPGTLPARAEPAADSAGLEYRVLQPTAGLQVAHDPRIPREFEALPMAVMPLANLRRVDWIVDGSLVASTPGGRYPWPLQSGTHELVARIWTDAPHTTDPVRFYVR